MLILDGLTVKKLTYETGKLAEAATRGERYRRSEIKF